MALSVTIGKVSNVLESEAVVHKEKKPNASLKEQFVFVGNDLNGVGSLLYLIRRRLAKLRPEFAVTHQPEYAAALLHDAYR